MDLLLVILTTIILYSLCTAGVAVEDFLREKVQRRREIHYALARVYYRAGDRVSAMKEIQMARKER
jgi:hypothetical protein